MNSSVRCGDASCLTEPAILAAEAPEPHASLSAGLFGRATVQIPGPATMVLPHTQFWLPGAPVQTRSLAIAGLTSSVTSVRPLSG